LGKELLCHLTMGSGRTGVDFHFLAHDNLLYLNRNSERIPRSLSEHSGDPVLTGLRG
jgi:hypothetical protein